MTTYDNLLPGSRVYWRGVNRTYDGTVEAETPTGWVVRVDEGRQVVLSKPTTNPKSREKDAAPCESAKGTVCNLRY